MNTFVIFPYTTPFSLYIYIYRLHKISKRKIPGFFFVIELLPVSHMDPLLFWLDLMALYKPSAWIRLCVWPACSCCAPPASIFIHVSKLYSALLNVLRRYRPCRYIVRQQQQHGRQCARTVATATAQQTRHSITITALDTHLYSTFPFYFFGKEGDSSSLNRSDIFSHFFFIRPSRHQDPRKQKKTKQKGILTSQRWRPYVSSGLHLIFRETHTK